MGPSQISICALLGKALRNDALSREFKDRVQAYVQILSAVDSNELYLAICGGGGEARQALRFLKQNYGRLVPPKDRRFIDPLSTNTIENFDALGRYLTSLLGPGRHQIRLTVVSSDYHLDRLRFVDKYLKPQSLVNSVVLAVHPTLLAWEAAPYHPLQSQDPARRWFAQIYTATDQLLLPLQINLEGILTHRLNRVVEPVFDRFKQGCDILETLGESVPPSIDGFYKQEITQVRQKTDLLSNLSGVIADLVEQIGGSGKRLRLYLDSLRSAISVLRQASDLDQQQFDRLFRER